MREIKFRAWDKSLNMMVYSKEQIGHIEYDTNPVDAINTMLNEDDYGLELMQYTGLEDKNSKLIYEGDICKVNTFKGIYVGEVVFTKGCFWVSLKEFNNVKDVLEPLHDNEGNTKFEVIGNIFENKDLLNNN